MTKVTPLELQATTMQSTMKHLLTSMKVFGLFFDPTRSNGGKSEEILSRSYLIKFNKLYSWLVLCMLGISCLRCLPGFWVGASFLPGHAVIKIITFAWFFQGFVSTVIFLKYCHSGTWHHWFKLWDKHIFESELMDFVSTKRLKQFVLICVTVSWFVCIGNVTGVSLLVFISDDASFRANFINPLPDILPSVIVLLASYLYFSAAWVFAVCLVLVISKSTADAFRLLSHKLGATINDHPSNILEKLEPLRKKHLELCRLVEFLDGPMRLLVMNLVMIFIFLACFVMYELIKSNYDWFSLGFLMLMIWVLTACIGGAAVSWSVAAINEAAHAPLDCIYDIQTDGLTTQQLGQLTLFLSKLTGTSIGFTAMGLFTITKEVILTIAGLYLTYFFLLLQFKI